ncbi:Hpt domain-containing protein [Nocardioides sp.]|uniref:Hpt domain-containing protein n=1 Tax=Nocardioides sp. TaxID=35761 RepID=UPI00262E8F99|nr:Hpt domain-containing protein [Nocardioides sp.]MDI6912232.1 Hpt domain-containing protein [Nocardioides sp.]
MSEVVETPAVFDPAAVAGLTGHPRDDEFALVLVQSYLRLLPLRLGRLLAALEAEDPDPAMDAVLSLKVSSRTLGAHELGALAAVVEQQLRLRDLPGAYAAAAALPPAATRVERVLADHLAV